MSGGRRDLRLFVDGVESTGSEVQGVVNVVTGDEEAGRELTTSPQVDMVSFTGSDLVGYKQSGLGVEQSDHGLHEFVQLKTVYWPVGRG